MTHISPRAGRRLAALALPALALLGPTARPAAAGNGSDAFVVTLDNGGVFTAVRPASGQATVDITGTITNGSFASEAFTESVTGPMQGASSLSASAEPFNGTLVGSTLPPVGVPEDFVNLLVGSATPLGLYSGSLSLSDGGMSATPAFTVDIVAGLPAAVPEPSTVAPFVLAGLGLLGLTLRARRRASAGA